MADISVVDIIPRSRGRPQRDTPGHPLCYVLGLATEGRLMLQLASVDVDFIGGSLMFVGGDWTLVQVVIASTCSALAGERQSTSTSIQIN